MENLPAKLKIASVVYGSIMLNFVVGSGDLDSIAVSVFVFILIDFDNTDTIRNKYTKKSDCEMSWHVYGDFSAPMVKPRKLIFWDTLRLVTRSH